MGTLQISQSRGKIFYMLQLGFLILSILHSIPTTFTFYSKIKWIQIRSAARMRCPAGIVRFIQQHKFKLTE